MKKINRLQLRKIIAEEYSRARKRKLNESIQPLPDNTMEDLSKVIDPMQLAMFMMQLGLAAASCGADINCVVEKAMKIAGEIFSGSQLIEINKILERALKQPQY